jgi:hypothetical protein
MALADFARLMNNQTTEAIRDLDWGDATFHGFVWENEGKDLKLHLAHASQAVSALICHWASDLVINLNWRRPRSSTEHHPIRRGGTLLTWECKMEVGSDGRWRVMLDFAHDGEVTFECESITAVTEQPPNQPLPPQS